MAVSNSSPSGFSYAQAARGQASAATSQAQSIKVTSATATPISGTASELGPSSSNWADDVEATAGEKSADARKASNEQTKPAQAKDSAVERTKSESRAQNGSSGVSSPDLTASSSTTHTDDSSTPPSGTASSDMTWETKSQTSEPAWIAERKERQSNPVREDNGKGKSGQKETNELKDPQGSNEKVEPALPQPVPKPAALQEAPPPAVNIWAKRMEDAKAKTPPAPSKQVQGLSPAAASNENQQPRVDPRKKANSVASLAREPESRTALPLEAKQTVSQGKQTIEPRKDRHGSKPHAESVKSAAPSKPTQREHQSLPNISSVPPPVKDEVSWPTPENAQEKERKDSVPDKDSKDSDESGDGEATSNPKPHQKTKWKVMPVTPTIVWETEEMNRPPRSQAGERGGRGGNSSRGRGGFRGGANGAKSGDRNGAKNNAHHEADGGSTPAARGRSSTLDRETMPPPPKPSGRSSASASRERPRASDNGTVERQGRGKGTADSSPLGENEASNHTTSTSEACRGKSPSKVESSRQNGGDVKVPEQVPRQALPDQAEAARASSDPARDNTHSKRAPADGRKDVRSSDGHNGREWTGAPRGKNRGGRGRGGSREYTNGHQSAQAFPNGHPDHNASGIPPSPTAYSTPRAQYGFGSQGRGGWQRGNPRSQSIPVDNGYGSRSAPYWPQQLPPVNTYYPGMYDYSGMPLSAMPYNPMAEHAYLFDLVATQLEYYFSLDNLLKDMFLRKNMDSQGFVYLDFIANFNRIKQLTSDKDLIKAVCLKSENIDIRIGEDGKERLRRYHGWERFLLPVEQREPSAQNEGPASLSHPEAPQLHAFPPSMAFRGPPSAGFNAPQRRSYDSGYMGAVPPSFAPFTPLPDAPFGDMSNGEEFRGRATKSPSRNLGGEPAAPSLPAAADEQDLEPDVFPDEHATSLTVVVKTQTRRQSHHQAASRTFSNGSIDTRNIFSEIDRSADQQAPPNTNGDVVAHTDGSSAAESRRPSPGLGRSPEKGQACTDLTLLWVKDKEVPQENLPQNAMLEPYTTLRAKALGQRQEAATGTCPYDLDVLYQFWSHFLIRNFNRKMYTEFKGYAHNDAQDRHSGVGLQNLVQFYAKSLASAILIRDRVVRDYVNLVNAEPPILQGLAFKQLRQAWRNGALNLKNRKKLADIVDEGLKASLES